MQTTNRETLSFKLKNLMKFHLKFWGTNIEQDYEESQVPGLRDKSL